MVVPMRTPEELSERFRAEGLKVTPQRQAVFRVLWENDAHPSAESVHAEVVSDMPSVSLRTVYQTLNDLATMGEIGHLTFGTGSARFDPNVAPHHHLVCEGCGSVTDIAAGAGALPEPGPEAGGFEIDRTEVTFRGHCATCAADRSPHPPTNHNQKEHQHG
jgi:Fe2+ or Zn2+ uptake regulation protein